MGRVPRMCVFPAENMRLFLVFLHGSNASQVLGGPIHKIGILELLNKTRTSEVFSHTVICCTIADLIQMDLFH